ncbi:hypothetical protein ACLOJK_035551 [Asimina triloba]
MGCVLAKDSMHSPRQSSLGKMKVENGYVGGAGGGGGGGRGRHPKQRAAAKEPARLSRREQRNPYVAHLDGGGGGSDDGRVVTRLGEKEGGGRSHRTSSSMQSSSADEVVYGWPKWLTDNVPKEALMGLVPKSAESYDKLDKVGQGTYSNVYKARDRDTGKIVALKKVRFDTSESESVKFMAREIMILRKLDHPNVVKLEGLATSRMQYSLYLVFDFMQSDLARVIARSDGRLTEPQIKCYMQKLLLGLQHCHERGILHRDIKGSNLLIDKTGMLKIGDFGLANYFNPNQKRPLTSRVVTLWYRAPELLLGSTDYGVSIDLWSAGCLLAEMFAGKPIMPGRTEVEQLHRIFKLCGSPSEDYWKKLKLPTSFRPLQPYKPSISEAFRDFPSSSLGLLATLLALDPAHRGSAASALQSEFFTTSPLACSLSGLPVMYKEEENESNRPYERRKQRRSKQKRSQTMKERIKDAAAENPRGDSSPSKEGREKSPSGTSQSQDTESNPTSASSSAKQGNVRVSPCLSPIAPVLMKRSSPKTEAHPWAVKNIQNLPPLPTSKMKKAAEREHNDWGRLVGRSASSSDMRQMEKGRLHAYDLDD